MKRGEMLERIVSVLKTEKAYPYRRPLDIAEDLLLAIEDAGMLPPHVLGESLTKETSMGILPFYLMMTQEYGSQKMTKSQAIAAIASEIILWQSRQAGTEVYNFDVAKELAEHLLEVSYGVRLEGPEELTDEQWQQMKDNAKISPEDREKLNKLKEAEDD